MYTGIVQTKLPVKTLEKKPGLARLTFEFTDNLMNDLAIGASVSVSGVCLTVAEIDGNNIVFDAMDETLDLTSLGKIEEGDVANIERSSKMGDEVGGHPMSGHIFGTAEIIGIEKPENNHVIALKVPPASMKYILHKGFIGLDGCSLTVVSPNKEEGTFSVHLIPETLRTTTFGEKKVGDLINLELDSQTQTVVDTVERMLAERGE
jgi:riboflavin synthase